MRTTAFLVLLLGGLLVGLSLVPAVRAQGTPGLGGIADFLVSAVDADHNGKIDALVGTFNATVTEAGNFRFQATLNGAYYYNYIAVNNTDVNLDVGSHALSVSIPGPLVYLSAQFGPYDLRLIAYAISSDGSFVYSNTSPMDVFTPAYNATDFEPPAVHFGSPISDAGVDTDGDGLYNDLVIHVPVVVNHTSYVQVQGCLMCYYYGVGSEPTEPFLLTPGTHTLDVRWDGMALRAAVSLPSGPWGVQITLLLAGLSPGSPTVVGQTMYYTQAYTPSQFEKSSASFTSSYPSVTTRDTNGNGLADFLVVHLPVSVRESGDYAAAVLLQGGLGPGSLPEGTTITHLMPGNQTVDVTISGIALNRLNAGTLQARAQIARLGQGGSYYDADSFAWTLYGYSSASFESRPVSTLTVNLVQTNGTCAYAYVYDASNRFIAFGSSSYPYPGAITVPLYDGTFIVIAQGCSGNGTGAATQSVTVNGPTSVTLNPGAGKRGATSYGVSVPSWNETDLQVSADLGPMSSLYRMISDFFGNADGVADANELRSTAELLTNGVYGYFSGPVNVAEDNLTLPFYRVGYANLIGTGAVTSKDSLTLTIQYRYRTGNAPRPGDHHRLLVRIPYSSTTESVSATVSLDASLGGNLSLVSRLVVYDGAGFTWPANATATKTGSSSWTIAVGQIPPGEPLSVMLEVSVDAYGTPPPRTANLLDYVLNPVGISLIVVAVAVGGLLLAARRKKTAPKPPA